VIAYIGWRVVQAAVVLLSSFTIAFAVLFVLPSDAVSIAVGGDLSAQVDDAAVAELQARYGLDQPLPVQYWTALSNAAQGDLGTSIATGQPVTTAIGEALPGTAALAGTAALLAVAGGLLLALASGYPGHDRVRAWLLALPPLGVAVPTFWVGLMLLQVFSFTLGWVPAFGDKGLASLVLPAITLAIPSGAMIAQVLTTSIATTSRQPFVETARAKGASSFRVLVHHVLRSASLPALTIAGLMVANLLAGAVVVETVFSRAGVGRLTQTSVLAQDIPVVLGIVVLSTLVFVAVNLVVDLLYPLIDPRVVTGARASRPARVAGTAAATPSAPSAEKIEVTRV